MADINKTIKALIEWIEDPNAMNAEIDGSLVSDALELLKEQGQLKIALSEGQKQVQSLLSSGRELEETINILKCEIERLKAEKADIMRGIERKIAQANSLLK